MYLRYMDERLEQITQVVGEALQTTFVSEIIEVEEITITLVRNGTIFFRDIHTGKEGSICIRFNGH